MQRLNKQSDLFDKKERVVSLHEVRSSWLSQIDNHVLREIIEKNPSNVHLNRESIGLINAAHASLMSNKEFNALLLRFGVALSKSQIKLVNIENAYIYYLSGIPSASLRSYLYDSLSAAGQLSFIAKTQLMALSRLLLNPVGIKKINSILNKLGVYLSSSQLQEIMDEILMAHQTSPYYLVKKNYDALAQAISSLNIKMVKRQFSGYLSLILNQSALSPSDFEIFKNELAFIKSEIHAGQCIENPFMSSVKFLRECVVQLTESRNALLSAQDSFRCSRLLNDSNKILQHLNEKNMILLFRQHAVLERWASSRGVGDALYAEIKRLAPRGVLARQKALALLFKLQEQSLRFISK